MSKPTSACPSSQQLAALAVGAIPPERAEQLVQHLEVCDACQSTLATLGNTSDTFVSRLQGPVESDPFVEEEDCRHMVQQIQHSSGEQGQLVLPSKDSSSSPLSQELARRLGDYEIVERLAAGGMGTVYKAVHTKLDRPVVLKVLPPDRMQDQQAVARFRREMKAVGRLDHPNIVRATDAGEDDGLHYLVMELVDGINLSNLVSNCGPLPIADACELIRQAAIGLDYAHDRGLIHRDIKPSNLVLSADGQLKILDFGLARLRDQRSPDELTSSGQVMGTLDYMAPEQASRGQTVDCRADIYSLGCTLYKLLTGQAPFGDEQFDSPVKKMMAHAQAVVSPIHEHRPDAPRKLDIVIQRMLAKEPDKRFSSAKEVAEALGPFTSGAKLPGLLDRARSLRGERQSTGHSPVMSRSQTVSQPQSPQRSQPKLRHYAVGMAALLFLSLGVIYASTLIQWASTLVLVVQDKGTLIVETDDPDVKVKLQDQQVTIEDSGGRHTYTLRVGPNRVKTGEYTIDVQSLPSGLSFTTDKFTIRRGGKTVVNLRLEPPSAQDPGAPQRLDLLTLIETSRDSLTGGDYSGTEWSRADKTLVSPGSGYSCLQIPFVPPDEYILDLDVQRVAGNCSIELGIVVGGRQCLAIVDGWADEGYLSGLFGYGIFELRADVHRGQVIQQYKPVSIRCFVSRTQVRLDCDGRKIIDWTGTPEQLSLDDPYRAPKENTVLFLRTWNSTFHVKRLELVPISGRGQRIEFANGPDRHSLASIQRLLWQRKGTVSVSEGDRPTVQIDRIRELPQSFSLKGIDLRGNRSITPAEVELISGSHTLETLDLCNSSFNDRHLALVGDLPRLREFDLSLTQITDRGLGKLKDFGSLRHLGLAGTAISDDGLRHVATLTELEELDLRYTKISDAGLEHLKGLSNLRRLELDRTRITDSSMARLGHVSGLRYVSLVGTRISDAGLEQLRGLKVLKEISVYGTDVTAGAIDALQQTLPDTHVIDAHHSPVNLLKRIDVRRDTQLGPTWSLQGDVLVSSLPEPHLDSTISIPYQLPEEYFLEMDLLRAVGDDAIRLGLVAGDSQFNVFFEYGKEKVFVETRGENYSVIGQTMRHATLLPPNQPSTIAVTVRKNGITVTYDGRLLIAWKGDTTKLSAGGHEVRGTRCAWINVSHHRRDIISRLDLTPISGEVFEVYSASENGADIQEAEN